MYLISGANICGQWLNLDSILYSFRPFDSNDLFLGNVNEDTPKLLLLNWSYNLFQIGRDFFLSGSWKGKFHQIIKIPMPEDYTKFRQDSSFLITGNDYVLYLFEVKKHILWVINMEIEDDIKRINLRIETPIKTTPKARKDEDVIVKVCATNHSLLCLTSAGTVYSGALPSQLDTRHCIGKVCDIQCGYEHYLLLTDEGRVYSWGNGRRLQLGHGDFLNLDSPKELEALAGIKITKISSGGWHSLALSESGDVYSWGWNDMGQLGIKEESDNLLMSESNGIVNSSSLPTLVDLFDESGKIVNINVKNISCGSRHSALLLEDNSVWTSGNNKFGQLGFMPNTYEKNNYFKKTYNTSNECRIVCGPWVTVIFQNK